MAEASLSQCIDSVALPIGIVSSQPHTPDAHPDPSVQFIELPKVGCEGGGLGLFYLRQRGVE